MRAAFLFVGNNEIANFQELRLFAPYVKFHTLTSLTNVLLDFTRDWQSLLVRNSIDFRLSGNLPGKFLASGKPNSI